jgi:3-dehydroquinate synthase
LSHATRIPIDIPGSPTSLVVERGAIARLGGLLADEGVAVHDRRVLLVVDRHLANFATRAAAALAGAHAHVAAVHVDATEPLKSLAAVDAIWHAALAHRVDRRGLFVAIGGGLVGDLGGFAAATYLRGVDLVQVPTTLLAMVDASIGGKTGVNLALPGGGLGKNLAGAFWQPRLAVADPDTLATLPARELRAGLAECIKHAVIAGEPRFAMLEADADLLVASDPAALDRLIPSSAAVKAEIVARDPFERGDRATLNLGHTFGHAIETIPGIDLLHGEAVAIGMHAACRCAEHLGLLAHRDSARIVALIQRCGLPTVLPATVARAEIVRRMGFDKKAEGGRLRLVLPRAIGRVTVEADADHPSIQAAIDAALAAIAAHD